MKKTVLFLLLLLLLSGCKAQEPAYTPVEKDWPRKTVEAEDPHEAPVVPWEELPIQAQYYEIPYNGDSYGSRTVSVDAALCTEVLGNFTAETRDFTSQKQYECKITLAKIHGISSDCAVAVQFEGVEGWYAYTNPYYKPLTLGDLIADLNLEENLEVGSAWYHSEVEFPGLPEAEVRRLMEKTDAPNVYGEKTLLDWMTVEVSLPLLGLYDCRLWVTEDGVLATDLLDTGKAFYIGEETVERFVGYVTNCCDGYRIVYE